MKHIASITKTPAVGQTTLSIKLTGTIQIIDRLLLAQRQAAWKVVPDTTSTTTGTGTGTTGITLPGGITL